MSTTTVLTIIVEDVDDRNPVFNRLRYSARVYENATVVCIIIRIHCDAMLFLCLLLCLYIALYHRIHSYVYCCIHVSILLYSFVYCYAYTTMFIIVTGFEKTRLPCTQQQDTLFTITQ